MRFAHCRVAQLPGAWHLCARQKSQTKLKPTAARAKLLMKHKRAQALQKAHLPLRCVQASLTSVLTDSAAASCTAAAAAQCSRPSCRQSLPPHHRIQCRAQVLRSRAHRRNGAQCSTAAQPPTPDAPTWRRHVQSQQRSAPHLRRSQLQGNAVPSMQGRHLPHMARSARQTSSRSMRQQRRSRVCQALATLAPLQRTRRPCSGSPGLSQALHRAAAAARPRGPRYSQGLHQAQRRPCPR